MIGAEHERPRPPGGEGFSDSVSFSFADPEAELYGLARIGLAPGEGAASALAVLFSGRGVAAATVHSEVEAPDADWQALRVAGVSTTVQEPLSRWRVGFEGDGGGFELEVSAVGPPLEVGPGTAAGRASGVEGYEQVCRLEGEVTTGGERHVISCLGQRGHGWGPPPWERISLARTVSAWLEGPVAVILSAVRQAGVPEHGDEAMTAYLLEPGEEAAAAREVGEPRLSTTYDGDGRQRRAGLELWVNEEDEVPRRLAGEVACGTSLELGRLRLDCAFFSWHMEGRAGVGRYDVLRRA